MSRRKNKKQKSNYLTVREVANMFRVSETHIYKAIKSGALKATKLGGRVLRLLPEDVEYWAGGAHESQEPKMRLGFSYPLQHIETLTRSRPGVEFNMIVDFDPSGNFEAGRQVTVCSDITIEHSKSGSSAGVIEDSTGILVSLDVSATLAQIDNVKKELSDARSKVAKLDMILRELTSAVEEDAKLRVITDGVNGEDE
jgi:excisionase family DNA binding protein